VNADIAFLLEWHGNSSSAELVFRDRSLRTGRFRGEPAGAAEGCSM